MVDTGLPEKMDGYVKVENKDQGMTFYVEEGLAREIDGFYVELSSIGVLFPRYFISSVKEISEN